MTVHSFTYCIGEKKAATDVLKIEMSHNEFNVVAKTKVQIILLNDGVFYTPIQ